MTRTPAQVDGARRRARRPAGRSAAAALIALLLAAGAVQARADSENDWFVPSARRPRPRPSASPVARSKLPPLPLPATPLRRLASARSSRRRPS